MASKRVAVICDLGTDFDDMFMAIQAFMDDAERIISLDMLGVNRSQLSDKASYRGILEKEYENTTTAICAGKETSSKGEEVKQYAKIERPGKPPLNKADYPTITKYLMGLTDDCSTKGETISIVNTTSFWDLADVLKRLPRDKYQYIEAVHAQGLTRVDNKGPFPDLTGANNKFDMAAAQYVYKKCIDEKVKLYIYNKHAATEAKTSTQILKDIIKVYPTIGYKLKSISKQQEKDFYERSCSRPSAPYAPHMNQDWYLNFKTVWKEKEDNKLPSSFDELLPYVKVVLYDLFAIIGATHSGQNLFGYKQIHDTIWEVGKEQVYQKDCLYTHFTDSLKRQGV